MAFVYVILRTQQHLPLNPQQLPGVNAYLSFNTAASFMTNTNWQAYGGETTMSYLTQMLALTFQNFVSAAVGIAVWSRLIRGFTRTGTDQVGNFWRDLVRGVLYVLLPLSILFAVVLMSQGVVQTLSGSQQVTGIAGLLPADRARPGREPTRDQAARHERRRVLQRRTRRTRSRTRRRLANFSRCSAILWIAVGAHLHVRQVGRQRPPGLGAVRGHVDPASWLVSSITVPGERPPPPRCRRPGSRPRRRTWRARRCGSEPTSSSLWAVATTGASNGQRELDARLVSGRSAGSRRCSTWASARSCSAGSAAASTGCSSTS